MVPVSDMTNDNFLHSARKRKQEKKKDLTNKESERQNNGEH
jgi:hypothetical protein